MNKRLTENEVEKTMDFMRNIVFTKVSEDMGDAQSTAENAEKWNSAKGMWDSRTNFASEVINGYSVLLERGKFGMVKV